MPRKFTTPEIDDALKIARETREVLLSGTTSVESSLLGFYTVAEILGEEDDLEWAKYELDSFPQKKTTQLQKEPLWLCSGS
ncbi:hypothetical protein NKOR_04615 [Candidatus Nitrosopumilus koreensis AR1]|uniref:Uncharacterized protein n=1 Tax=Candidatus Nitrosopumilus koreensis AR1 TaxID=1229908 RepID=K0B8M0_9ARCH|nr:MULTISPECIES: hypothetical protein [Nitrosopumilus]AFS80811.1 hypothetical protein NKOR_04615 [Candidatus Nitrosopumilus koreensis AR1]